MAPADDPIYPCKTVAERHKLYCYLMVTSRILPFVNYDFAKAAKWCRKSDKAWIATCFQSLGRDASGQTRGDIKEILAICAKGGDMETECVYGAGRDLTSNDGAPQRSEACAAKAAAPLQDYCFEGIGTILGAPPPPGRGGGRAPRAGAVPCRLPERAGVERVDCRPLDQRVPRQRRCLELVERKDVDSPTLPAGSTGRPEAAMS